MQIEVNVSGDRWGLYINGQCIAESKLRCDADLAAKILRQAVDNEIDTSKRGS